MTETSTTTTSSQTNDYQRQMCEIRLRNVTKLMENNVLNAINNNNSNISNCNQNTNNSNQLSVSNGLRGSNTEITLPVIHHHHSSSLDQNSNSFDNSSGNNNVPSSQEVIKVTLISLGNNQHVLLSEQSNLENLLNGNNHGIRSCSQILPLHHFTNNNNNNLNSSSTTNLSAINGLESIQKILPPINSINTSSAAIINATQILQNHNTDNVSSSSNLPSTIDSLLNIVQKSMLHDENNIGSVQHQHISDFINLTNGNNFVNNFNQCASMKAEEKPTPVINTSKSSINNSQISQNQSSDHYYNSNSVKDEEIDDSNSSLPLNRKRSASSENANSSCYGNEEDDESYPDNYDKDLDTVDIAHKICSELKRYGIPQAVFAQRVLKRSQGTLSDLLRNPKPWNKLKSGRETFRKMWKWLQEPEQQRMAFLKESFKRKSDDSQHTLSTSVTSPLLQQSTQCVAIGNPNIKKSNPSNNILATAISTTISPMIATTQTTTATTNPNNCNIIKQTNHTNSSNNNNINNINSNSSHSNSNNNNNNNNAKKPRLVFTDIQRRTLHAIFKETKRPSKDMQTTIAQQLHLELSTVANFFMNARRRSLDKYHNSGDNTNQSNNNGDGGNSGGSLTNNTRIKLHNKSKSTTQHHTNHHHNQQQQHQQQQQHSSNQSEFDEDWNDDALDPSNLDFDGDLNDDGVSLSHQQHHQEMDEDEEDDLPPLDLVMGDSNHNHHNNDGDEDDDDDDDVDNNCSNGASSVTNQVDILGEDTTEDDNDIVKLEQSIK